MSEILKSKKGFILHKDSLSILNKMSDEQAGILFKAIYQYQTTGKTPDLEFGLEMAITPFINQFIRDDNAWEEERNKKAVNGFLGNLKRWHPDLYKKYNNDQITIEEAEKIIAERQSAIGGDSQPSDTIPNIANIAVNVSDSVKVSVKDSVNENKPIVQNENHFEQFWTHYTPIETSIGSKAKAKKKYQEYLKKYTHDKILEAMQRYIDHCKKNKQKTKMCYGFFDEHLESYMNVKKPIEKEEDKIQKLKSINEIAGQKLFSSPRQLQFNDKTVFLFLKNEDDEQALRNLPESKRNEIKDILKDMLENKELKLEIANFHL